MALKANKRILKCMRACTVSQCNSWRTEGIEEKLALSLNFDCCHSSFKLFLANETGYLGIKR